MKKLDKWCMTEMLKHASPDEVKSGNMAYEEMIWRAGFEKCREEALKMAHTQRLCAPGQDYIERSYVSRNDIEQLGKEEQK